MLKVFYTDDTHINYVDQNNRYAGMYDDNYCCEDVGHGITDKDGNDVKHDRIERDRYGSEIWVFDNLEFANEPPTETPDESEYAEEGGNVRFKLINPTNGAEYTLEFHNYHNGYYAHTVEYGANEHDKQEIEL